MFSDNTVGIIKASKGNYIIVMMLKVNIHVQVTNLLSTVASFRKKWKFYLDLYCVLVFLFYACIEETD